MVSDDKKVAYLNAACARASVRIAGMQSRNMDCMIRHMPLVYKEKDFLKVIEEEGIGENDVIHKLYHS